MLSFGGVANARKDKSKENLKKNLVIFNLLMEELRDNYVDSIDFDKMIEHAIMGAMYDVDPYTEYIKSEDQGDLKSLSTGKFSGIGSYISKRGDKVIISEPQDDTPSSRAGLRHGDRILAIDGETLPPDIKITDVTKKLQGTPGTEVTIDICRPYTEDSLLTFKLTRGEIDLNPIPYYGMITPEAGYLKLTTFSGPTADEFRKAVADLVAAPGIKGLIVDLRGNTGGLLEGAIAAAGCFLPKATEVVRVVYKDKSKKVYRTTRQPVAENLPLVILTDGMTASSSEILAGSLQDLDRAVIVGRRSYGKGLVQTTCPLPAGNILKVTVGKYYIPSGRLVQAINYADRDSEGNVKRIPDSLTNVFHTRLGREVRDGGGVTPDSVIPDREINRLLYNIITDEWAYNFANRYRATADTMPDAMTFEVDSVIFNDFKAFIDPSKFKYDRQIEEGLKYMREAVKIEGYASDSVLRQLDVLEKMLRHNLDHDLEFNRDRVIEILDDEISARYFPLSERTRRSLKNDPDVEAAIRIIGDRKLYDAFLKPSNLSGKSDK